MAIERYRSLFSSFSVSMLSFASIASARHSICAALAFLVCALLTLRRCHLHWKLLRDVPGDLRARAVVNSVGTSLMCSLSIVSACYLGLDSTLMNAGILVACAIELHAASGTDGRVFKAYESLTAECHRATSVAVRRADVRGAMALAVLLRFYAGTPMASAAANVLVIASCAAQMSQNPFASMACLSTIACGMNGATLWNAAALASATLHYLGWSAVADLPGGTDVQFVRPPEESPASPATGEVDEAPQESDLPLRCMVGCMWLTALGAMPAFIGVVGSIILATAVQDTDVWCMQLVTQIKSITVAIAEYGLMVIFPQLAAIRLTHSIRDASVTRLLGDIGIGSQQPWGEHWSVWLEGVESRTATLLGNVCRSSVLRTLPCATPITHVCDGHSIAWNVVARLWGSIYSIMSAFPVHAAMMSDNGLRTPGGPTNDLDVVNTTNMSAIGSSMLGRATDTLTRYAQSNFRWTINGWFFSTDMMPWLSMSRLTAMSWTRSSNESWEQCFNRAACRGLMRQVVGVLQPNLPMGLVTDYMAPAGSGLNFNVADPPAQYFCDALSVLEHNVVLHSSHGTTGDQQSTILAEDRLRAVHPTSVMHQWSHPSVCTRHLGMFEKGSPAPAFKGARQYTQYTMAQSRGTAHFTAPACVSLPNNAMCLNPMPSNDYTLPMTTHVKPLDFVHLMMWGRRPSSLDVQPAVQGVSRSTDGSTPLKRQWFVLPPRARLAKTLVLRGSSTVLDVAPPTGSLEQPPKTMWPHLLLAPVAGVCLSHFGVGTYATFALAGAMCIFGSSSLDRRYVAHGMLKMNSGTTEPLDIVATLCAIPHGLITMVMSGHCSLRAPADPLSVVMGVLTFMYRAISAISSISRVTTAATTQLALCFPMFGEWLDEVAKSDRGVTSSTSFAALTLYGVVNTRGLTINALADPRNFLTTSEPVLAMLSHARTMGIRDAINLNALYAMMMGGMFHGLQVGRIRMGYRRVGMTGFFHPVLIDDHHELDVNIVNGSAALRVGSRQRVDFILPMTTSENATLPRHNGHKELGPYGAGCNCFTGMMSILTHGGWAADNPMLTASCVMGAIAATPVLASADITRCMSTQANEWLVQLLEKFGHIDYPD